jgi:hypothetical protein
MRVLRTCIEFGITKRHFHRMTSTIVLKLESTIVAEVDSKVGDLRNSPKLTAISFAIRQLTKTRFVR